MKRSLLVLLFLLPAMAFSQVTVDYLVNKMTVSVLTMKTATYTFGKSERINGKMRPGAITTHIQTIPFKVYLKVTAPDEDKDTEILYCTGERDGEALVNPNMLPFNVNLSPTSDKLSANDHHTLFESGFTYIKDIIVNMKKKYATKLNEYCKITDVTWNGKAHHKVEINFPDFAYVNYTVLAGEDVVKISRKLFISEYMVKTINNLKDYKSVKAGQVIKVPNVYAKKTIFYVDKVNYLPMYQEMHDEKGLYEKYEITNFVLNPKFSATEFTKDHSGYGF